MKDHEIRILHDNLAACARRFASTQQLRSRLVGVIAPLIKLVRKPETWIVRQDNIVDYWLEIPNLPGSSIRIEYMKRGKTLPYALRQRIRDLEFGIKGEIKVPNDVEIELIE